MRGEISLREFETPARVFGVAQLPYAFEIGNLERVRNRRHAIQNSGDIDGALARIEASLTAGLDETFHCGWNGFRRIADVREVKPVARHGVQFLEPDA